MADADRSQRTEKPTQRRIIKAREQGRVFRSGEVSGVAVLVGFLVFCRAFGPAWLERAKALLANSLAGLDGPELTSGNLTAVFHSATFSTSALLIPPLGMLAVAGLAGNALQGRPPLTLHPLTPNLARLNPAANLGRLFALTPWVEAVKSLLKMSLYTLVAFLAVRDAILASPGGAPGAEGTLSLLLALGGKVIFRVALLAAALAVLDYLYKRYEYYRGLMMTKKEVRDERKELEGDPLTKARIRSKQMALARTRMMAEVPKASVVVTNPTHVAVALRFVPGEMTVPKVLAKGRARIAERIREIAAEHRIPIVCDPPLARALHKSVPVGGEIPAALYRAVAEVLALVFARGRRRAAPGPEEARP